MAALLVDLITRLNIIRLFIVVEIFFMDIGGTHRPEKDESAIFVEEMAINQGLCVCEKMKSAYLAKLLSIFT